MGKPTEEQIKKLWEWCGIKTKVRVGDKANTHKATICFPIDLNNLFEYAVPKLSSKMAKYKVMYLLKDWVEAITIFDKDPALALFWAIWEVMETK